AENFEDNDHVLSKSLNKNVKRVTLDVCSYQDTQNETELWLQEQDNNASPVAVGLAMKLLACNDSCLNINLLPKEISEAKTTEKHTLITANIAAAILFIIILSIGFLSTKGKKAQAGMQTSKNARLISVCKKLVEEQTSTKNQIRSISNKLKKINNILQEKALIEWGPVLSDLSKNTPHDVQITNLTSSKEKLDIEGKSLSYQAIHLFVEMLDSCDHIKSAKLSKTFGNNEKDDVLRFSIHCSLNNKGTSL
ncbi:MAG: PilN domain-containing protein, partial [Planctomycetota bacterium]